MLQNHALFHVLASKWFKTTRFSTFLVSKLLQNHAFFYVLVSELLKNTRFSTYLASEFIKNTRVSTYLASKRCVFPRFGFRIAQKRVFFNVFAFKVAQNHVFSQVLASTLFKNVHLLNFLFTNCYSHTFFDVFGLKRFKKPCFFAMCFVSKSLMQGVFFYRQAPLHTGASRTKAFTHRRFTHESFYTQKIYTQTLLYNKLLYTHKLSHAKTFKDKCFLPWLVTRNNTDLHTKAFTHRKSTHKQSTHRLFCTANCFTHISFCTPKHLNTSAVDRGL